MWELTLLWRSIDCAAHVRIQYDYAASNIHRVRNALIDRQKAACLALQLKIPRRGDLLEAVQCWAMVRGFVSGYVAWNLLDLMEFE